MRKLRFFALVLFFIVSVSASTDGGTLARGQEYGPNDCHGEVGPCLTNKG